MEGSNSLKIISLSPHIDLYLVKNLTLSTKSKPKENDPRFLLALVLHFLPTLEAMTKDRNKNNTTKPGANYIKKS